MRPRTTPETRSPLLARLRWGRVEVEGIPRPFRDVKLYPGGARAWDWRETGTAHRPGIQLGDVEELLAHGARVIVLSRGVLGLLATSPGTLRALARWGIPVHQLRTPAAVRRYNELAPATPVGALIHSTC